MRKGSFVSTLVVLAAGAALLLTPPSIVGGRPRDFPPSVPAPQAAAVPTPALRVLPNGLKVLVVERHSLPLVSLRLVVGAGPEADAPLFPSGTAEFVASMLDEGTEHRTAGQIGEAVDDVGGTLDTGADWDRSYAAISVLRDHADLAFDLLSDIIVHPAFSSEEVERLRRQTLSALDVLRNDPQHLADSVFDRVVFAGTPYSHPAEGTEKSVRSVNRQDLQRFHDLNYVPANAMLAVVGDISASEAFAEASKYFGNWRAASETRRAAAPAERGELARVVVINKPDAVQTEIRVGNLAIRRDSPDFYALTLANQILGGAASNRLFNALRSQHGLAYGASSDLEFRRTIGAWEARTSTRTEETLRAVDLVLEQMKRLRDHPLSREEVEGAQNYLVGHQALDFETAKDIASEFLNSLDYGLPLDYWSMFPERIRSLGAEEVWQTARRYLNPEQAVIVLVGNAAVFEKGLKKFGPVEVLSPEQAAAAEFAPAPTAAAAPGAAALVHLEQHAEIPASTAAGKLDIRIPRR